MLLCMYIITMYYDEKLFNCLILILIILYCYPNTRLRMKVAEVVWSRGDVRKRVGPNVTFYPGNVVGNPCINSWRVRFTAEFPKRRYAHLRVHTLKFGMNNLQRPTGISLNTYHQTFLQRLHTV